MCYAPWMKEIKLETRKEGKNMSKADEMFEKLGYQKSKTNNALGYINKEGTEFVLFISGINEPKKICIHRDNTEYPAISMQELKAINEKVKELRLVR